MTKKEEILRVLAPSLRPLFCRYPADLGQVEEIRLRAGQPLMTTEQGNSVLVSIENQEHVVTVEEVQETMNLLSRYSRYAYEDKIRQGFLTIQGGHRVGLAGRVVMDLQEGRGQLLGVKTISPVTFLNIRIARQILGCGEPILPWIRGKDTLLVSPPGVGKTTLLRDLIRLLSREGWTVGVVDERSELAACDQGIPQNDLGPRTDVLDGCPKALGMMMLMRSMAPKIIAVDEIGEERDGEALAYAMHCGCHVLATAHAGSWQELKQRPMLSRWWQEGRFECYVFLSKDPNHRYEIWDKQGERIWQG